MDEFIYGLVSSSFFTFIILLIIFVFVTHWAILEREAYRSYGLGWLIALFIMIVVSSLTSQSPEEAQSTPDLNESRVQLELFQVLFSIFLAIVVAGSSIAIRKIAGSTPLIQSLQVVAFTTLIIMLMFFFFVVGDIAQRMISIFTLAFAIIVLFLQIVRHQIDRTTADRDVRSVQNPQEGIAQNRVQKIREQMERDSS